MIDTPIVTEIDYDAPGKTYGRLRVPRSNNEAGWSSLFVPVVVVNNGDGPTVLVMGGNHGDEPVGVISCLNLLHELRPQDVHGRLIVLPCLSPEAAGAYTRLWPSGANFNRSFPGRPDGPANEQLADYVTRVLFPMTGYVVDIHSNGRTGDCLPWSEMHPIAEPQQRRGMVEAMGAWNTDWNVIYIDIAGSGLLVGEAERQGKIVAGTELGSGGHMTRETYEIGRSGLANLLRHFGVLEGRPVTREQLGKPPARMLSATNLEDYPLAPESGFFEPLVNLGDRVESGQVIGRVHFLERPDRTPEPIHARSSGLIASIRSVAATTQGDNVFVVAREITFEEALA